MSLSILESSREVAQGSWCEYRAKVTLGTVHSVDLTLLTLRFFVFFLLVIDAWVEVLLLFVRSPKPAGRVDYSDLCH